MIVNVTSGVTFQPLPLMSIYTASKAAVNAFTESLALELAPLGVRARIVIPGRAPETPFGDNARARMGLNIPEAYETWRRRCSRASSRRRTSSPGLGRRRGGLARGDRPGLPDAPAGRRRRGRLGGGLIRTLERPLPLHV